MTDVGGFMQSRSSSKTWLGLCVLFILGSVGLSTLTARWSGESSLHGVLAHSLIPSLLTGIVVVGAGYCISRRDRRVK